ncbi:MAG TPA: APC family permease [Myxococcota bacterium]|nr:APC family permease [Myxococcota bacterium]
MTRDTLQQERDLGALGAFSIGIGGIVGGGIFATLGLAGSQARGATGLSFLVGGAVALLTAYSYVRLSLRYPGPGGTVTFLNRAFGTGLFTAWLDTLLVVAYVVIMALYAGAFASYVVMLLPASARDVSHPWLAPGIVALLGLVNLLAPQWIERSEGFFNAGKLGILLLFVIAGLASRSQSFERLGPASWVPVEDILASGMLIFLSYEGFELIANASDRVRDPERALPLAYYGSIVAAVLLYVLIATVAIGHLSFEALSAAQDHSVAAAAEIFLGRGGFVLMGVGAILATVSAINADFFGAGKLPVMLATEGQLPARYARKRWGRHPAALGLLALLAAAIARYADLHAISSSASAAFLLVFAMVNAGNAKLAAHTGSRAWISVAGAAACLAALALLVVHGVHRGHPRSLELMAAVTLAPLVYQLVFRAMRGATADVRA